MNMILYSVHSILSFDHECHHTTYCRAKAFHKDILNIQHLTNENINSMSLYISLARQLRNYKQILLTRLKRHSLWTVFCCNKQGTTVLFSTNIEVVCVIATYNVFIVLILISAQCIWIWIMQDAYKKVYILRMRRSCQIFNWQTLHFQINVVGVIKSFRDPCFLLNLHLQFFPGYFIVDILVKFLISAEDRPDLIKLFGYPLLFLEAGLMQWISDDWHSTDTLQIQKYYVQAPGKKLAWYMHYITSLLAFAYA